MGQRGIDSIPKQWKSRQRYIMKSDSRVQRNQKKKQPLRFSSPNDFCKFWSLPKHIEARAPFLLARCIYLLSASLSLPAHLSPPPPVVLYRWLPQPLTTLAPRARKVKEGENSGCAGDSEKRLYDEVPFRLRRRGSRRKRKEWKSLPGLWIY